MATPDPPSPRAIRAALAVRWMLVGIMAGAVGASALLLRRPAAGPVRVFACPMHPSVVDDRPTDCPICGMALEPARGLDSNAGVHAGAAPAGPAPVPAGASASPAPVPGLVAISLTAEEVRRSVLGSAPVRPRSADAGPWLEIPAHALVEGASGTYVFVTRDDRLFIPTPVEIQSASGSFVSLVAGLSPEDRVVAIGASLLDAECRLRATLAEARGAEPR